MNIRDLLEYRYLELTDDLSEIGTLLFCTDSFIYPALFGNKENAQKIISEAIRREVYCFSKRNIFCAFMGNRPVAIICKNLSGKFKWDYQEWMNLFHELKIEIPHTFDNVAKHYFLPMNAEKLDDYIYILAICVSADLRHLGIGTEILNQFMMLHSREKLILDTLADNVVGKALYNGAGFSVKECYRGYNVCEPYPQCIRMVKE